MTVLDLPSALAELFGPDIDKLGLGHSIVHDSNSSVTAFKVWRSPKPAEQVGPPLLLITACSTGPDGQPRPETRVSFITGANFDLCSPETKLLNVIFTRAITLARLGKVSTFLETTSPPA